MKRLKAQTALALRYFPVLLCLMFCSTFVASPTQAESADSAVSSESPSNDTEKISTIKEKKTQKNEREKKTSVKASSEKTNSPAKANEPKKKTKKGKDSTAEGGAKSDGDSLQNDNPKVLDEDGVDKAPSDDSKKDRKSKKNKDSSSSKTLEPKEPKKKRDKKLAEDREGVIVPVLYLTDRDDDEKKTYGSRRKYIVDCKHDMYYGTANVVVRNTERKHDPELFQKLDWKLAGKRAIDELSCDKISCTDADGGKVEFFNRLQKLMELSGTDDVCLFVHGADESFDDAALDAAAMAYSMQCPLILYSWPSVPKTISYVVDGGNNEWSQGHFNTFVKDLIEFKKNHKLHLIIVSHSMGNRLVIRAAVHLERTQLVKDVELVSPDIDAETFKHYVMGMENQGAVLRLYTSTKDKMLPLSQMMYGGYYRLGEGVGEVFGGLGKKKDDDKSDKNDDPRIDSKSDDDIAVSSGNHLPHHKRGLVERIDFTAIDEGLRGHSIPFDTLANMVKNDEPGKGLALVASKPGKGSGLARFMSWSHHLGKFNDDNDTDLCKRIVRVEEKKEEK